MPTIISWGRAALKVLASHKLKNSQATAVALAAELKLRASGLPDVPCCDARGLDPRADMVHRIVSSAMAAPRQAAKTPIKRFWKNFARGRIGIMRMVIMAARYPSVLYSRAHASLSYLYHMRTRNNENNEVTYAASAMVGATAPLSGSVSHVHKRSKDSHFSIIMKVGRSSPAFVHNRFRKPGLLGAGSDELSSGWTSCWCCCCCRSCLSPTSPSIVASEERSILLDE